MSDQTLTSTQLEIAIDKATSDYIKAWREARDVYAAAGSDLMAKAHAAGIPETVTQAIVLRAGRRIKTFIGGAA